MKNLLIKCITKWSSEFKFSLVFLTFSPVVSSDHISLSFVDVGQGNCTVVIPKDREIPVLIVDCGSIEYSTKGINVDKNVESIADRIRDGYTVNYSSKNALTTCFLVISHRDADHINKFDEAFRANFEKKKIRVTNLWLGGKKECYLSGKDSSKFMLGWEKYIKEQNPPGQIVFPAEESSEKVTEILRSKDGSVTYEIFPALPCNVPKNHGKSCDTNSCSLVVRINCTLQNDSKFNALIMGDATKKTTDHFLTLHERKKLALEEVNVIGVSHHGASSSSEEGCNHLSWLQMVKPKTAIFSSGIRNDYKHPAIDTVINYAKFADNRNGGRSDTAILSFKKPTREVEATPNILFSPFFSNYLGACVHKKWLLGTISLGTIEVVVKNDGQELYPHRDENIENIFWPSRAFALLKLFIWCVNYLDVKQKCDGFDSVNFSRLVENASNENNVLFNSLFGALRRNFGISTPSRTSKIVTLLPSFDLSFNQLNNLILPDLKRLINLKQFVIGSINLEGSELSDDEKNELKQLILTKAIRFD